MLIHRSESESGTTHVSDSEPEFQATQRKLREDSPSFQTPSLIRTPLRTISNIPAEKSHSVDGDLSMLEKELVDARYLVQNLRRRLNKRALSPSTSSPIHSGVTTPPRNKRRCMKSVSVGGDSPVGRLCSPRIHRSSLLLTTPEREELSREMSDETSDIHDGNSSPVLRAVPYRLGEVKQPTCFRHLSRHVLTSVHASIGLIAAHSASAMIQCRLHSSAPVSPKQHEILAAGLTIPPLQDVHIVLLVARALSVWVLAQIYLIRPCGSARGRIARRD
ncbi:hypothetical protein K438DRAFT_1944447 [Mycena galopus ATCC 62051]|nr:hypothetical protein K438DRAFT_1944447 [Mycena galopus ATCC 62051]